MDGKFKPGDILLYRARGTQINRRCIIKYIHGNPDSVNLWGEVLVSNHWGFSVGFQGVFNNDDITWELIPGYGAPLWRVIYGE